MNITREFPKSYKGENTFKPQAWVCHQTKLQAWGGIWISGVCACLEGRCVGMSVCVCMGGMVCLCSHSVYRLGIRQARTGSVTLPCQSLYLRILIELQACLSLSLNNSFLPTLYFCLPKAADCWYRSKLCARDLRDRRSFNYHYGLCNSWPVARCLIWQICANPFQCFHAISAKWSKWQEGCGQEIKAGRLIHPEAYAHPVSILPSPLHASVMWGAPLDFRA